MRSWELILIVVSIASYAFFKVVLRFACNNKIEVMK